MNTLTRHRAVALSLATAGLLAASVTYAPAAAAATSASCPATGSVRLVTLTAFDDPNSYTQLWVHKPAIDRTVVCFVLPQGLGSGAIVVDSGVSVTPPTVTQHTNPAACAFEILTVTDPVPVRITYGRVVPTSICLTVDGRTTVLTIQPDAGAELPGVQVWRDGTGSVLDIAACAPLLALALAELAGAQEYHDCTFGNARIL